MNFEVGLVGYAFDQAVGILTKHRSVHEKTAELLLQKETLEADDIAALRAQIIPAEGVDVTVDRQNAPTAETTA